LTLESCGPSQVLANCNEVVYANAKMNKLEKKIFDTLGNRYVDANANFEITDDVKLQNYSICEQIIHERYPKLGYADRVMLGNFTEKSASYFMFINENNQKKIIEYDLK